MNNNTNATVRLNVNNPKEIALLVDKSEKIDQRNIIKYKDNTIWHVTEASIEKTYKNTGDLFRLLYF